jgi:hypothetical protein
MTEQQDDDQVEDANEDEASFQEPEPAPEPPVEQQTHTEGGDSDPETNLDT